jgi:hypothetical protein
MGVAAAATLAMSGCSRQSETVAPPRSETKVPTVRQPSQLSLPVELKSEEVRRIVEQALPRTLWTIDQRSDACVPPQRVKLFGARIKVTPAIGCRIVGTVTRGPVRLRGEGRDILADVPINAAIAARDVGGVLKGETATGTAMAHARIRLDLDPNWQPRGTVRLGYDWTTPPGIDFLGQRITFTDKAEEKLAPVLAKLEADLPRELAKADVRGEVEAVWRRAFTSVSLNDDNPPVWMRITPQRLSFGGYRMEGPVLRLNLGLEALTETFVGERPADPQPSALPPLGRTGPIDEGFRFFIPVTADYRQLEPVILKALIKRSARPFDLPGIGGVTARFEKVVAYGTGADKIAVGVTLAAQPVAVTMAPTRGTIWFVARPVNRPGSARVGFEDLEVTGDTDGVGGDLLIALGNSPAVSGEISGSLTQNFSDDLTELLGKVRRAIALREIGPTEVRADVARVQTGRIRAFGEGLYLPVRAIGTARVSVKRAG